MITKNKKLPFFAFLKSLVNLKFYGNIFQNGSLNDYRLAFI